MDIDKETIEAAIIIAEVMYNAYDQDINVCEWSEAENQFVVYNSEDPMVHTTKFNDYQIFRNLQLRTYFADEEILYSKDSPTFDSDVIVRWLRHNDLLTHEYVKYQICYPLNQTGLLTFYPVGFKRGVDEDMISRLYDDNISYSEVSYVGLGSADRLAKILGERNE
jgi:hypothetical protein